MVGLGVPAALIAGGVGYFGGSVTRWIIIHATDLGMAIMTWEKVLWQDFAEILWIKALIAGLIVFPTFVLWLSAIYLAGVGYPYLIGAVSGGAVAFGAEVGNCRKPWFATLLGLVAGVLAYTAVVRTALLMNAPLHENSRIFGVVSPPIGYGLMVIDGLIVLFGAVRSTRNLYKSPYCESCGKWHGTRKKNTIPIYGGTLLVEALASGSAQPLQGVPVGVTDPARIQLDLSRCECGQSDYNLVGTVYWEELGRTKNKPQTVAWLSTTLPASLGADIERWLMPTPLPMAAQFQNQDSAVQTSMAEGDRLPDLALSAPGFASGVTPSPAAAPTTEQASATQICKRCGHTLKTSDTTCPYCGYTRWRLVIITMIFFLLCLGTAILGGSHITVPWLRTLVMWGGGIVVTFCLLSTISVIVKGLQTFRKQLPKSTLAEVSASVPGPAAAVTPSPTSNPQAVSKLKAPRISGKGASTVHVTVKISGTIHGSAEHLGTYEMTLPLDMNGPHLLNTIASQIMRPNGPVTYYSGYQLYGPWGTSPLTCEALSTETLRILGVKDGDVVDFCDMGGSFK
jgi:hypothetical protein